jgi:hypothetical protein
MDMLMAQVEVLAGQQRHSTWYSTRQTQTADIGTVSGSLKGGPSAVSITQPTPTQLGYFIGTG